MPDIQKHLNEIVGRLVVELATAKAVIESLEQQLADAKKPAPPDEHTGAAPV